MMSLLVKFVKRKSKLKSGKAVLMVTSAKDAGKSGRMKEERCKTTITGHGYRKQFDVTVKESLKKVERNGVK